MPPLRDLDPVLEAHLPPTPQDEAPPAVERAREIRRPPTLLILANIVAAAFYVTWWRDPAHIGQPVLFALLAAAEAFSLVHLAGFWWAASATRFVPAPRARSSYQVDVLIPTRGEPIEVLRRTIEAAVAMDGPHRTYVLDDAARPEVETLARALGANYLARLERTGAKAGNLNAALRAIGSLPPAERRSRKRRRRKGHAHAGSRMQELVVVFDADHAPRKDFLARTLGYFEDPKVAFVQTPQYYGNADANEVARGAYQQQTIFYGPICRGKEGLNSAFCCGTNVVFRRRALEQVGGFDEESIVEDFVTSMRIHRKGWRSVYYPYVLAEGLGPEDTRSYFRQQFRWARGSIGALMRLEPLRRGLRLEQRMQYLLATTFYLIGLVTAVYVSLPIVYFLFGMSPFSAEASTFVFFYAPHMALALVTLRWGVGGRLTVKHLQYTFGCFPTYCVAAVAAILGIPARFRVTSKGASARERPHVLALVTLGTAFLLLASMVYGVATRPLDARTVTNLSWASLDLLLLGGIVRVTLLELRSWLRGAAVPAPPPLPAALRVAREPDVLALPELALGETIDVDAEARERAARWTPARIVAAITAAAFAVRLALTWAPSLRLDEALTLAQARMGLGDLWSHLLHDNVHVPAYHTLMWGWTRIAGDSLLALRAPSILAGTAAIPLLYVVARRLTGVRSALYAAAVGAVLPFWVWHSTEARMYPLMLVAALGGLAALFRALERDTAGAWASYAIVLAAGCYVHYFMLLMPLVHVAYLAIARPRRSQLLRWLVASAGAGTLFLPWAALLVVERIGADGVASFTNAARLATPTDTVTGSFYTLLIFFMMFALGYQPAAALSGMWPVAALGIVVVRSLAHLRKTTSRFLLAWLVLTVGLVFALSAWKPGVFLHRYLIAASPPVLIVAGAALARSARRVAGVALVLASLLALTVVQYTPAGNPLREPYRETAQTIRERGTPRDVVATLPHFLEEPVSYYLGRSRVTGIITDGGVEDTLVQTLATVARAKGAGLWLLRQLPEQGPAPRDVVGEYLDDRFERTASILVDARLVLTRFEVPADFSVPVELRPADP